MAERRRSWHRLRQHRSGRRHLARGVVWVEHELAGDAGIELGNVIDEKGKMLV